MYVLCTIHTTYVRTGWLKKSNKLAVHTQVSNGSTEIGGPYEFAVQRLPTKRSIRRCSELWPIMCTQKLWQCALDFVCLAGSGGHVL